LLIPAAPARDNIARLAGTLLQKPCRTFASASPHKKNTSSILSGSDAHNLYPDQ